MKTQILSLLFLPGLLLSGAEKIFELNGENGLDAIVSGTVGKPLKATGIQLVPGMEGKAIFIPANGSLIFNTEKLDGRKEGTVTFWVKLDTKMKATLNYFDRDRLPDGSIGEVGGAYRDLVSSGAPFAPVRISHSHIYAQGINGGVAYYKRMFPGKWHFFAFSWNAETKKTGNLIDFNYTESEKKNLKPSSFGNRLIFGSANHQKQGLNGIIDNFIVYDKALSKEELIRLYAKFRPLEAELHDYALNAGKNNTLRLRFKNLSEKPQKKTIGLVFLDSNGIKMDAKTITVSANPGEFADLTTEFKPEKAGLYQLVLDTGRVFEILALSDSKFGDKMRTGELNLKLIEEIDCTEPHGKEKFLSDGTTRIETSRAGKYREGSNAFRSAFTYKLNKLKYPKRYHVLELEYPDDTKRTFSVTLFSERFGIAMGGQMNGTGIFTGGEHPVSGKMQKRRLLWVPYSENVAVICENYKPQTSAKGAALSKIRIYETQDEFLPKQYATKGDRSIGVWDEDIAMDGMWFNMNNLETNVTLDFWKEKAERMAEYAKYMGYSNWTFQFYDYNGDRNGSFLSMPRGEVPGTNGHIFGWCDVFAKIFERENIKFFGRIGIGYGGNAPMSGLIGEENLAADFDDYCSRGKNAVERVSKDNLFGRNNRSERLNPLHPVFLKSAKRAAAFYRDKYVKNPMFQGITFRESNVIFSLVGLDYGYEDWTISQFEKDTGIKVPADHNSKKRFAERYLFLTSPEMREKWIRWRCNAFAKVCGETVKELRKGNDRLRLQLWLNCETSMANSIKENFSVQNTLRESGYDMKQLAGIDGLEIVPIIRPEFEHMRPEKSRQESYIMYSRNFADAFAPRSFQNINMHLHNNLEQYRFTDARLKEFFWKMGQWSWSKNNFHYGTWANGYPNAEIALLPLTNLLANMDLQEIYLGWWGNPDSGVTDLFRPFYRAFRSIPAGKYKMVSDVKDPVAIRVSDRNFYLVNKESFPVRVTFKLNSENLTDLVENRSLNQKNHLFEIIVPGQGLQVYTVSGSTDAVITEIKQHVESADLNRLNEQMLNLDDAAKITKDPKLIRHREFLHMQMKKKNYTEARRYLYRKDVQAALKSLGVCHVTGELLPLEKKFQVKVQSLRREPLNAVVKISKTSGCWNVNPLETKEIRNLKIGEKTELKFELENPLFQDGWGGTFEVAVSVDGDKPQMYTFLAGGPFVYHSDLVEIGKDWSFSKYNMKNYKVHKKNEPEYSYRLGYTWNRKGLFLAADVEDRDFFPPKEEEHPFKRDSVQFFIDGNNTSEYTASSYDNSVFESILFLRKGKPFILHSAIPENGTPAGKSGTKLAVKHEKGRTFYEFFIPASELPHVKFKHGSVIGACLMVNNVLKIGDGEKLVTSPEIFPWMRPGTWTDLILFDKPIPPSEKKQEAFGFQSAHSASVEGKKIDGKNCIVMRGEGNGKRSGWVCSAPRPIPFDGKIILKFTARSGGGNQDLWILIRGTDWKGGMNKTFRLTPEWKEYEFTVEGSKFKPGTKSFTVDFSMNPGEYQFSSIKIETGN